MDEYASIQSMIKLKTICDDDLQLIESTEPLCVEVNALFVRCSVNKSLEEITQDVPMYKLERHLNRDLQIMDYRFQFLGTTESSMYYHKVYTTMFPEKKVFTTKYIVKGHLMVLGSPKRIPAMDEWFRKCLESISEDAIELRQMTKHLHILFRMRCSMVTTYSYTAIIHGYSDEDYDGLKTILRKFNRSDTILDYFCSKGLVDNHAFRDKKIVDISITAIDTYMSILAEEVMQYRDSITAAPDSKTSPLVGVILSTTPTSKREEYEGTILEEIKPRERMLAHKVFRSFAEIIKFGQIYPYYFVVGKKIINFYNNIIKYNPGITTRRIIDDFPNLFSKYDRFTKNSFTKNGLLDRYWLLHGKLENAEPARPLIFTTNSYEYMPTVVLPALGAPLVPKHKHPMKRTGTDKKEKYTLEKEPPPLDTYTHVNYSPHVLKIVYDAIYENPHITFRELYETNKSDSEFNESYIATLGQYGEYINMPIMNDTSMGYAGIPPIPSNKKQRTRESTGGKYVSKRKCVTYRKDTYKKKHKSVKRHIQSRKLKTTR
jgi:hypothetical protein